MVRHFSGMVSASFAILFMKIKVEWHSVIFCSFGAFFGLIFGNQLCNFKFEQFQKFIFHFLLFYNTLYMLYRFGSYWPDPFQSGEETCLRQHLVQFLCSPLSAEQVNWNSIIKTVLSNLNKLKEVNNNALLRCKPIKRQHYFNI